MPPEAPSAAPIANGNDDATVDPALPINMSVETATAEGEQLVRKGVLRYCKRAVDRTHDCVFIVCTPCISKGLVKSGDNSINPSRVTVRRRPKRVDKGSMPAAATGTRTSDDCDHCPGNLLALHRNEICYLTERFRRNLSDEEKARMPMKTDCCKTCIYMG